MAIATQSVVQGMVQALFGAAAGGHLGSLTTQATSLGSVGLASSMLNAVPITLGVDLTDNEDFIDHILTNLGVEADTDAYDAALAWAGGQLTAGASRATLVAGAVQYLLELTDETSDYFDLAQAFQESVELAVEWSEGDGADTLGIDDLVAYIDGGQFTLTRALAAKEAADEAVNDAVDAFIAANEDTAVSDADELADELDTAVTDAIDAVEAIVDTWGTAGFSTRKNAALVAAETITLEDAVSDAEDALADAADAIDPTDSGTAAKAIKGIKAVVAALEAQDAAATAASDASDDVTDAAAEADAYYAAFYQAVDAGTDDSETEFLTETDGVWEVNEDAETDVGAAFEDETDAIVATYLAALQTLADALTAQAEADAAETAADELVTARLAIVEAYDDTYTDGTELTFDAADYADALSDLADAEDELAALPEALADYAAAVAAQDAFTALTDAAAAADAAFTDNGFEIVTLADEDDLLASADVDLYFITDLEGETAAEINGFGSDGADKIYIGADFALGGAADKVGVLEVFLEQDGADVIVTIETETYAYSTASAADEIVITLIGVDVDDLSFANGVLTVG